MGKGMGPGGWASHPYGDNWDGQTPTTDWNTGTSSQQAQSIKSSLDNEQKMREKANEAGISVRSVGQTGPVRAKMKQQIKDLQDKTGMQ